jgi:hypothetical protein
MRFRQLVSDISMASVRRAGCEASRRRAQRLGPPIAVAAFGLGPCDVHAELTAACAGAEPSEDDVAYWAKEWCGGWDRRFGRDQRMR